MKGKRRLIAVVCVLGLLSTGCFTLRGFVWTKGKVGVGKRVALLLHLRPTDTTPSRDHPFVLVGLNGDTKKTDPLLKLAGPRKFDIKGAFGAPRDLIKDNVLRDFVLNEAFACNNVAESEDETVRWFLYRTAEPVRDKGEVGKTALTKLTFEGVTGGEIQTVVVYTGGWDDLDGNDDPNGEEEVGCFGSANTSLQVGPFQENSSRSELKELYDQ